MFRPQQITIREHVCTSLKLLNYVRHTEYKILKIIPGVVATKRVAGIRGDPCGAVRLTHSTTRVTTCIVECEVHWLVFIIKRREKLNLFSKFSSIRDLFMKP